MSEILTYRSRRGRFSGEISLFFRLVDGQRLFIRITFLERKAGYDPKYWLLRIVPDQKSFEGVQTRLPGQNSQFF